MTANKNSEKFQENANNKKSDKLRKRPSKTARRTTEEMPRTKATSRFLDTVVEKNFRLKYAYGTVKVRFNYGILLVFVRKRFYVPYCIITLLYNYSIITLL